LILSGEDLATTAQYGAHVTGYLPIRLALMNDHPVVAAGVHALLAPYTERVRVVELASQLPVTSDIDLLLYDTFGRERVDESVKEVLSGTAAKVVLYTWSLEPELVAEGSALGVSGFLSKALDALELVEAIEKVHAGSFVVDPPVPEEAPILRGAWPGREHGLTARESEVLALIAQGLSNYEIADRTFISINSVKSYIRSAYRRIGVGSRTQAVLWAIDHGFVPAPARILSPPEPQVGDRC
jgi:NarL family two-component system response regulator LiaR